MEYNAKTGLFQAAMAMAQEIANAAGDFSAAMNKAVNDEDEKAIEDLLDKAKKDLVNMDYAYEQIMGMRDKADYYDE